MLDLWRIDKVSGDFFRRQINMKHAFILEPFIRPVDEVGRIGIIVFLQQLLSGIKSCWDRLLVPLVTFLRKVTNGTNASLVTFSKKSTNEFTALPIPS